MSKKRTTRDSFLVVALLFFLTGFFISNTTYTGEYTYKGVRGCTLGDINNDGVIANEDDFSKMEHMIRGSLAPVACADLNDDGVVNEADMQALMVVAKPINEARAERGRYCFDECIAGEKICVAEHKVSVQTGQVIAESEGNIYKVCGDFDEDPCTEWSYETLACPQGMRCRIKNPGTDICESSNLPEENLLKIRYPTY